jgi:hypothetical protein
MSKRLDESYVRGELARRGWELLSSYKDNRTEILIRNPKVFRGYVCTFSWDIWSSHGARPAFRSIIDKTGYVRECLAEEGWELLNEYKSAKDYLHISKRSFFEGAICKVTWDTWSSGGRPNFLSLVSQRAFVEKKLLEEGWELIGDYKTVSEAMRIRNIGYLNGTVCKFTWTSWARGIRPNFKSIEDKTQYVKDVLLEAGYTPEETWSYASSRVNFTIIDIKTGNRYRICWSKAAQGIFPNTLKYKMTNAISNFYRKARNHKSSHTPKDLFDAEYWINLKRKIPCVPKGYQLDHIVPQAFYGDSWEQVKIVNDPRNLRLLTKKENMERRHYLKASELDKYDLWDLYYKAENPMGYQLIEDRYNLAS